MIKYIVKQFVNETIAAANGKWYAFPVVDSTWDLNKLAEHMATHNSGFSKAMCLGVMTAMVGCIKEQLLDGKNVKIDDLAIFSVGIHNQKGAETAEAFSTSNNIAGVKLRARSTGDLSSANLNLAASLKKVSTVIAGPGSNTGNDTTGGTSSGGSTPSEGDSTPSEGDVTPPAGNDGDDD